jgi:hypothetical protein
MSRTAAFWERLHEKGGKRHEMPCHHNLEIYLHAYIDGCQLESDPKGPLFRIIDRGRGRLTTTFMVQANAWRPGNYLKHPALTRVRFPETMLSCEVDLAKPVGGQVSTVDAEA